MENNPVTPSQRRFFLMVIISGISAALAVAAGWPVWKFLAPRKGAGEAAKVGVPRDSVAVGDAYFFNFRGQPAVVLHTRPGTFAAFSAVCTHLGCVIKWQGDKGEFLCPCHAGRFSADGTVLGGPPPKPLETLPVSLDGDMIFIG